MVLYFSRKYGGGIVSSGSSNGVIVTTMDTTMNTIVLPRSIMLYAVDEYLLVDFMGTITITYHDMYVTTDQSIFSRKYTFDSFLAVTITFWYNMTDYPTAQTISYTCYDSNGVFLANQERIDLPNNTVMYTHSRTLIIYQPVKPEEYPESVYWSLNFISFRSRLYIYGTPVVGQLFVFYIPDGNNKYYQQ